MEYQIRTARDYDLETLNILYTENMKSRVEEIYPWNETLFRRNFVSQEYQVIQRQQKPIGFFKIVASATDIYLAEIQIANQYQNKGIGTSLIKSIVNQALNNNKRIWLKVIKNSPAQKLYQRLGFTVFEESATHKKMEIKPIKSKNST